MTAKHSPIPVSKWLPRLIPFFITSAIYVFHFDPINISIQQTIKLSADNPPTLFTAFLKCCPMFCLIAFVVSQEEPLDAVKSGKQTLRYKACIAIGLILGCVGDACLVFASTFIHGMFAFSLGHIFYIYAFGFNPLKPILGGILFILSTILLIFVREGVPDKLIRDAMPFYSVLLVTMCWRALARKNSSPWRKIGALGGILFIISDFMLVLQFKADIPYGELIVIITYYGSQMCTALSVLDVASNTKKD